MNNYIFGMLDMLIVGIPAAMFVVWQLVSVNREIARDKAKKAASADAASPESAGHPVGEHGLDDR